MCVWISGALVNEFVMIGSEKEEFLLTAGASCVGALASNWPSSVDLTSIVLWSITSQNGKFQAPGVWSACVGKNGALRTGVWIGSRTYALSLTSSEGFPWWSAHRSHRYSWPRWLVCGPRGSHEIFLSSDRSWKINYCKIRKLLR